MQEWRQLAPVLSVMDGTCWASTGEHGTACTDENKHHCYFHQGSGILDFGEDPVRARVDRKGDDEDDCHWKLSVHITT